YECSECASLWLADRPMTASVRSLREPVGPAAILCSFVSECCLTTVANFRCSPAHCSGAMLPPHPHISLPMPTYATFQGLSRPFSRRRFASVESESDVMYSIHSIISCVEPVPTLMLM